MESLNFPCPTDSEDRRLTARCLHRWLSGVEIEEKGEMLNGRRAVMEQDEVSERHHAGPGTGIGIRIDDATSHRLIEAASLHLDLPSIELTDDWLASHSLSSLELIVADEDFARTIQGDLDTGDEQVDGINPGVIAVCRRDSNVSSDAEENRSFEAVLLLPQEPTAVVAQLGLILYAHRAFARRYESAMEELQLNRRIFRSVTSGISVSNAKEPDMPLVYVNPAFEVMTGYSLEETQGKNCRFLQQTETEQPGLVLVREALKAEREVVAILKNYRKDGTAFWNELSLSPIRNRDGELTHFVGIQNDVTARVEFEAALRESEKLAAVGRLAASIAHEINNPLESVMNLLYLAQGTEDRAQASTYLAQADKELQRVSQITSQSLRFYRQSTRPLAVRFSELLESVLDVYQGRLENADLGIEKRERMTESIVCLESEIRQVLSNLIRNAMDSMQGMAGRLLLRTREATDWRSNTKGVLVTIVDTGRGMSSETLRKLYTAFYTTKGIGGTGLGLWVSAEIVQRHRGRLLVRSSQRTGESGTVFTLFLPYQGLAS